LKCPAKRLHLQSSKWQGLRSKFAIRKAIGYANLLHCHLSLVKTLAVRCAATCSVLLLPAVAIVYWSAFKAYGSFHSTKPHAMSQLTTGSQSTGLQYAAISMLITNLKSVPEQATRHVWTMY